MMCVICNILLKWALQLYMLNHFRVNIFYKYLFNFTFVVKCTLKVQFENMLP